MRFSRSLVLALPALALAEEQIPLMDKVKGFFNKATAIVSSAVPAVPSPADAGAAKVAEIVVSPLTQENWRSVLVPSALSTVSDGPEHWMVFITGGNKTCFGLCGNATLAWNQSVALLSAHPTQPHLATLDCEENQILCNAWAVGPPSIYYFLIPSASAEGEKLPTDAHYIPLNRTSVSPNNITDLYTKEEYKNVPAYESYFHPFDGIIQQYGLDIPLGHTLYWFSKMPSWLPMIAISFISRTIMGRKMQQPQRQQGGAAPAAQ